MNMIESCKRKLRNTLVSNKTAYKLYHHFFSVFFRILSLFVCSKRTNILFCSFSGRRYDDSPRALYEYMISSDKYQNYQFFWAFHKPEEFYIPKGKTVKTDTLKYFLTCLRCSVWIHNAVSMQRGLHFKSKNTIVLNTWHGSPIKRIMGDAVSSDKKGIILMENIDVMTAQSDYDANILSRLFQVPIERMVICDLPRNDSLVTYSKEQVDAVRNKLGISVKSKIALYMPTYREFLEDREKNSYIVPPITQSKWKSVLGGEWVVLFRGHYLTANVLGLTWDEFFINVSDYEVLNDLYIVSDILISDYSSAFFDYSILERPMYCFAYDLEEYKKQRGLYIDIKELPCSIDKDEDTLLENIQNEALLEKKLLIRQFKTKYVPNSGNACKTILNYMEDHGMLEN